MSESRAVPWQQGGRQRCGHAGDASIGQGPGARANDRFPGGQEHDIDS